MYTVNVLCNGTPAVLAAERGEKLLDVLVRGGIAVTAPCGGCGKCGKCRAKVIEGLSADADGTCLACKTLVEGNCSVEIIDSDARVLIEGIDTVCECDGEEGFGLAVDIGTTTVAAYILDLATGKTLRSMSKLNPQRGHGADVISRLEYAAKSPENAALLKKEIDSMMEGFLSADFAVRKASVVGNTVMMHLAGGYDSASLAKAPFTPFYKTTHTRLSGGVPTLFGGVVSGYVGADTVAATMACDIDIKDETALMIDIGTNGEIVLKHRNRYLCCSCAAGPAFEGAHITCGTGAVTGAIDHVKSDGNGSFTVSTIGNTKASGICGSGLVDAIACMLDEEIISPSGRMQGNAELTDEIYIAPQDIREVQLAKAAISAGILILMDRMGVTSKDIQRVYLAGGFGNYIDVSNACKIGLLPSELSDRITPVGNAAGTGARMLTLSGAARERYEQLRTRIEYIELSDQDDFEDVFADCLIFDDED